MTNNKISIIGAGAWGCAIAQLIANNGNFVKMFTNEKNVTKLINQNQCPALPGIELSKQISADDNLELVIKDADFLFIVVPSKVFSSVIDNIIENKISDKTILVLCSKGIDRGNLQLFSQTLEQKLPQNNYAVLSGPNFALQVAKGLPSIATVASGLPAVAKKVSDLLNNKCFLTSVSDDVKGTQLFGAVKNILAIGCGMVDGLGIGENAKAALVVYGSKEMSYLIDKIGGKSSNFISPAGLGDLFLTCSSNTSRNNKLGFLIGSGKKVNDILKDSSIVYEGFEASQSVIELARKHKINLPLCETINKILSSNLESDDIKNIIQNTILS